MNHRPIPYRISTGFVACVMTTSGGLAISHMSRYMAALAHLGYPPYFADLLGVGKLAGIVVLLAPGLARFKEWAYAGFAITVLSAAYSHLRSGDGWMALDPLVTFIALVISYRTRPPDKLLSNAPNLAPGSLNTSPMSDLVLRRSAK